MHTNKILLQKISDFSFDKDVIEKIKEEDKATGEILFLYQLYNDNKLMLTSLRIYKDYLSRLVPILEIVPKIDFGDEELLTFMQDLSNIFGKPTINGEILSEKEKYVFILLLLILIPLDKLHLKSEENRIKIYMEISSWNISVKTSLDKLLPYQVTNIFKIAQSFTLNLECLLINEDIGAKEVLEKRVRFIEANIHKFFENEVDFVILSRI